jgi:hypothetical protein
VRQNNISFDCEILFFLITENKLQTIIYLKKFNQIEKFVIFKKVKPGLTLKQLI